MDKQIMDVSVGLSSPQSKDFIDLMNNPREEEDQSSHVGAGNRTTKKDSIMTGYDFQPIRPFGSFDGSSPSLNLDSTPNLGGSSRACNSFDHKPNTCSPIRSYGSVDSIEPAKVILEKDRNALDFTIVSEIDGTLKKHTENLLHLLEGVSARLSQLESRTRNLENSVDDLKTSVGSNHGSTDGRMRHLENILREVRSGVLLLKDKQEILDAQLQLGKLHFSKPDQQPEKQSTGHVDSLQKAVSAPQQAQQQLPPPISLPPWHLSFSPSNTPPQPTLQQNLPPPSVQLPNQYPPNQIPSVPQPEPHFPTSGQTQEVPNQHYQAPSTQPLLPPTVPQHQHYQAPSTQPLLPPTVPQHQQYQPTPQPQFSQPPSQPPQHHQSIATANPSQFQSPVVQHPEELLPSYVPSSNYPSGRETPMQLPNGPHSSHLYYGLPYHAYEPPSIRPSSGLSSGFGPSSGLSESYHYGGSPSQYGSSPGIKPQQFSPVVAAQGSASGYSQLPSARPRPHAMPTASGVGEGSGSGGSGNRVPIDDVVNHVTSMGFPRDHVRTTVRKLTENGQSVDLNVVIDKLTNEGEIQPPRGWFDQ